MCGCFVELIQANNFSILFLFYMSHFCLKLECLNFKNVFFFLIKKKKYTYIKKCANTL